MKNENYPGVLDRVKAVVFDAVIMIIFCIIVTYFFSIFKNVPVNARIIAFIFIFILYDPIFTSTFGGTIGHMMAGIRVKKATDQLKNIILPVAIIRYLVKASLGWISLLTITKSKNCKAIHDFLAGSVVVYKDLHTTILA